MPNCLSRAAWNPDKGCRGTFLSAVLGLTPLLVRLPGAGRLGKAGRGIEIAQ